MNLSSGQLSSSSSSAEGSSRVRPQFYLFVAVIFTTCVHLDMATEMETQSPLPSNLTEALLAKYDRMLRPDFGGPSLEVLVSVGLASFGGISEVNMDFTMTIYFTQIWRDPRLMFDYGPTIQDISFDGRLADRLWLPDTYFPNDKETKLQDLTVKNRQMRIRNDGTITYGLRLTVIAQCLMQLERFPHDTQMCYFTMESYGYTTNDMNLSWDEPYPVYNVENVSLPEFDIIKYDLDTTVFEFSSGDYVRLYLCFWFERRIGYFAFQTYMPSILTVMLSWVSFWINHEASSARVALGITTVLTMTTVFSSTRSSLPRFSYVKAIDLYLLLCFLFVFVALLEYAFVNYNFWKVRRNRQKKDKSTMKITNKDKMYNELLPQDDIVAIRLSTFNDYSSNESPDLPKKAATELVKHMDIKTRTSTSESLRKRRSSRYANHQSPVLGGFENDRFSRSSTNRSRKRRCVPSASVSCGYRMPIGEEVIIIDQYARIIFLLAFVIMNGTYWWYYIGRSTQITKECGAEK